MVLSLPEIHLQADLGDTVGLVPHQSKHHSKVRQELCGFPVRVEPCLYHTVVYELCRGFTETQQDSTGPSRGPPTAPAFPHLLFVEKP